VLVPRVHTLRLDRTPLAVTELPCDITEHGRQHSATLRWLPEARLHPVVVVLTAPFAKILSSFRLFLFILQFPLRGRYPAVFFTTFIARFLFPCQPDSSDRCVRLSLKSPVRSVAIHFFSFAFSSTLKSSPPRFETPFRSITWHSAV